MDICPFNAGSRDLRVVFLAFGQKNGKILVHLHYLAMR